MAMNPIRGATELADRYSEIAANRAKNRAHMSAPRRMLDTYFHLPAKVEIALGMTAASTAAIGLAEDGRRGARKLQRADPPVCLR